MPAGHRVTPCHKVSLAFDDGLPYLWLESILWWLILTCYWDPVANLLAASVLSGSKTELVILNHCSRSDLSFSSVFWILDLQECHKGVIGTSASFYVLELSRFLTLLEQAICDWTMGLRPALAAVMKLGAVANLVMSALSQSVISGYKKWHSSACIVFHLGFICVWNTLFLKSLPEAQKCGVRIHLRTARPSEQSLVLAGEHSTAWMGLYCNIKHTKCWFACSSPHS